MKDIRLIALPQPLRKRILRRAQADIAAIARKELFIDTLKNRNSDSLDFHERHVSLLASALRHAWEAGFEAGSTTAQEARA